MTDIGGFLWTVLGGGTLSALLLGIAAIMGKSQLIHWLNKDIEEIKSQHQKALEADKAKYARELETYRTSLIAQAEAIKASQDVKKSIAVLMAEKKFRAIDNLHKTLDPQVRNLVSYFHISDKYSIEDRFKKTRELIALQNDFSGAISMVAPFICDEEGRMFSEFSLNLARTLDTAIEKDSLQSNLSTKDIELISEKLLGMHINLNLLVQGYIKKTLSMVDE